MKIHPLNRDIDRVDYILTLDHEEIMVLYDALDDLNPLERHDEELRVKMLEVLGDRFDRELDEEPEDIKPH